MYENENTLIFEAAHGNEKRMEELINKNVGLIWSIVKRFIGRGYETEDLYQIACMGFIKAIKRFDFKFQVKLSTYAVPYILGEIKKFIRDDGIIKVSRRIKELGLRIREIEKDYFIKNGESVSVKKMAVLLKVSEEDVLAAIDAGKQVESINEEIYEEGSCEKIEKIAIDTEEHTKLIDKLTITELVEALNIRDREVIKLRFYKEKTQTQVAKILGISQVQVSRIEKRILSELKEKLMV